MNLRQVILEIDDTLDGERLYRQHKKGTYEEIVDDGTKDCYI